MQPVTAEIDKKWPRYLDNAILFFASSVPVGIVIGNVGFELAVALTGGVWLIRAAFVRENPFANIYKNPALISWGAWLLCIWLSLAVNGPGSKGIAHDIVFLRFFLFSCAVADLSQRRNTAQYMVWGLAAGVLFGAFNMLLCHLIGMDLFGRDIQRYTIKLKEAARLSGLTALAFPFLALWAVNKWPKKNIIHFIIILVAAIAIITLWQLRIKTAIISAGFGVLAGLFMWRYSKMKKGEILLCSISFLIVIFLVAKILSGVDLRSYHDRIGIWKVTLAMWKENPFLGVGISSFQDVYTEISKSGIVEPFIAPDGKKWLNKYATHAHNLPIMLLSSTGILGLLSFFGVFISSIAALKKTTQSWKFGLYTWPIVFLVLGLAGWNIYHSWYQALFSFFVVLNLASAEESPVPEIS